MTAAQAGKSGAPARVVLEGLGRLGQSDDKPCSLIAASEVLLKFLGHRDCDYTWLMGVSGAAFHVRWHPAWHLASGMIDDPLYVDHAFAAVGRAYWYTIDQPIDVWAEITLSLDARRPVLVKGLIARDDYGVIAGYAEEGRRVFGVTPAQESSDYVPADKPVDAMENLIFVGAAGAAPDRTTAELASLGTAISVLRGASHHWLPGQVRGMPAWAAWAGALRDDGAIESRRQAGSLADLVRVNESLYAAVSSARATAAAYLRRIAPHLPSAEQRDAVARAGGAFVEVAATLESRVVPPMGPDGHEQFVAEREQRHAWAALVEKAAKYDQAGLLALEQGWQAPASSESRAAEGPTG